MRGRTKFISALAVVALGLPAVADTTDDLTRGEKLAWHIEAYVPCQDGVGISDLKAEVSAFEATRDELLTALDLLELDETACMDLKKTSGKLLALAMNEPEKFDLAFNFLSPEVLPSEEEQVAEETTDEEQEAKRLTPPPSASALKSRSSY